MYAHLTSTLNNVTCLFLAKSFKDTLFGLGSNSLNQEQAPNPGEPSIFHGEVRSGKGKMHADLTSTLNSVTNVFVAKSFKATLFGHGSKSLNQE